MPGIAHLSGGQNLANDLLRAGGGNAEAAGDKTDGSQRAAADAVQEAEPSGRQQRGANPDRNDAEVRRERERLEARARRAQDRVELSEQADEEREESRPPPRASSRAARPVGSLRARFVGPEDPPRRRLLEDVTA